MKLIVNPHKIEIEKNPVNEREINISKCEFEFAPEITNDYVKEAYFTYNGVSYKQIIVNNECDIPYEVLNTKGQIELGVVAFLVENETEIKRYNPSPAYFESWIGSLKDNAENSEPITPSEMEQYEQALQDGLEEVNDKLDDIDQALEDVNTAIEETNNLDLDVSKEGKVATVTLTKKDATTKEVTLSDGTSLMFNWDGTKLGIKTDEDAEYTYVDLQGIQGPIGPKGEAFTIKKTYTSVAEMNADFNNMQLGDYVMIASTTEIEDNAKLYTRGETQWIFISDFSGAQGIRGETGLTPNIQIGTVVSGNAPAVTRTGTNEQPVLNFVLEKGDKGDTGNTGPTGNGIASIVKTSTSGLVDTYTITYTNGNTTTFDVTNGEVSQAQLDEVQSQVDYYKTILNALPKVNGTGTSITLENTAEAPMSLVLNPSEIEQETTTGANLQKYTVRTLSSGGTKYECFADGQVTITGTGTSTIGNLTYNRNADGDGMTLSAGTYTLKIIGNIGNNRTKVLGEEITLDNNQEYQFTLNEETTGFYVSFFVTTGEHNENFYVTLASGTTATTERYTSEIPAPNPSYPQTIHTITGNNKIYIQTKNYFDGELEIGSYSSDGEKTDSTSHTRSKNYIPVQPGEKYKFSDANGSGIALYVQEYDKNYKFIIRTLRNTTQYLTTTADTYYITFRNYDSVADTTLKIMMSKGETAQTYVKGEIQTLPLNLPIENLFDKDNAIIDNSHYKSDTGVITSSASSSGYCETYIKVKPNTTYTINGIGITRLYYYDNSKNWIKRTGTITLPFTFITASDYGYIQFQISTSSYDSSLTQIEESSIPNSYTPYGTPKLEYCKIGDYSDEFIKATNEVGLTSGKWYLKKNVKKMLFNGTENWAIQSTGTSNWAYRLVGNLGIEAITDTAPGYINLYESKTITASNTDNGFFYSKANTWILIRYGNEDTVENYKTFLSNNNLIVYGRKTTPEYILLNDTLQTQLENIYNYLLGYQDQTNISQINADLSFNIDASAIKDISNI